MPSTTDEVEDHHNLIPPTPLNEILLWAYKEHNTFVLGQTQRVTFNQKYTRNNYKK